MQIDQIRYHFNNTKAAYESERQALVDKKEQIIQETNTKKAKNSENFKTDTYVTTF